MELRHLRYFVAAAEAGSLAAHRKLPTWQPSMGRQIRGLEHEIGVQLLMRRARGVELTPAGRAFLEHARLVLSQGEAADLLDVWNHPVFQFSCVYRRAEPGRVWANYLDGK
jgi:LysR family hca operon transcriptional activator